MNITRVDNGEYTAILKFQFEETDYKDRVSKVLKDYRRKANVPGFRPGMVPEGLVRKMYGKAVLAEEVNKLLSESLESFLSKENISILGSPIPAEGSQPIDFDNQTDFEYSLEIGLAPKVDFNLSDIEVERIMLMADEDDVNKALEDILIKNGSAKDVETSEENDHLFGTIVELDENKQVKEGGISTSRRLMPTEIINEEIRPQFIGVKTGDVIVFNALNAVNNDSDKLVQLLNVEHEIAKTLTSDFQFTIESITRDFPAELNEELYKKIFPNAEITTEADFRKMISDQIAIAVQPNADRHFFNNAVTKLVETVSLPLPEEFLKRQLKITGEGKLTDEQIENEFTNYLFASRWNMIEEKILEDNNIRVEKEEVRKYIADYFVQTYFSFLAGMGDPTENEHIKGLIDNVMKNTEEVKRIYDVLIEQKLTSFFVTALKISEKHTTFKQFAEDLKQSESQTA